METLGEAVAEEVDEGVEAADVALAGRCRAEAVGRAAGAARLDNGDVAIDGSLPSAARVPVCVRASGDCATGDCTLASGDEFC